MDGYSLYKLGSVSSLEPSAETILRPHLNQNEPSWIHSIPLESSTTDSDTEQGSPLFNKSQKRIVSSSSYTLDLNVGANTVYLSKPTISTNNFNSPDDSESELDKHRNICPEIPIIRKSKQREHVPKSGWHNATQLREKNGEKDAYNTLTDTYTQHEQSLLKQLLNTKGLPLCWSEVLIPLVHEIVDVIRPDLNHDANNIDIRQYVKFKKLVNNEGNSCKLIRGIVCTKNVAHRGMSTVMENPHILILKGSIVYQRIEGRLTSLDPVIMQVYHFIVYFIVYIFMIQINVCFNNLD